MTLQPGLVSVTFRHRPWAEVIGLARQAGLKAIEWHGINHVPPGELPLARQVGQTTRDAGLCPAAYGSYYVIGRSEQTGLHFESVLQTALELGSTQVRVWAGDRNPDETPEPDRGLIIDEARRIADLAAENRVEIVLEFHEDSLTQTGRSCRALLESIDHSNVRTYWQPAPSLGTDANLAELTLVLPWLAGLHVFHWTPTHRDRHPLAAGATAWSNYLTVVRTSGTASYALLEFVKDDSVEQFDDDAATLLRLMHPEEKNDDL